MIEVWINGERRSVEAGLTVAQLLEALGVQTAVAVVEKNLAVVSRDAYGTEPVEPGDRIELIRLMGGG